MALHQIRLLSEMAMAMTAGRNVDYQVQHEKGDFKVQVPLRIRHAPPPLTFTCSGLLRICRHHCYQPSDNMERESSDILQRREHKWLELQENLAYLRHTTLGTATKPVMHRNLDRGLYCKSWRLIIASHRHISSPEGSSAKGLVTMFLMAVEANEVAKECGPPVPGLFATKCPLQKHYLKRLFAIVHGPFAISQGR